MALDTGRAKLTDALKTLNEQWLATEREWNDAARRHFDETFLQPIPEHVGTTTRAIDRIAEVIARMKRDCS